MSTCALHHTSRRAFLRRVGQLAATGAGLPMALNLAAFGEAAAFDATDYKALVCVFMVGGNDQDNTVVPYDAVSHDRYRRLRSALAVSRGELGATVLTPRSPLPGGRQYALHPRADALARLFNAGHAAVQLNVGPLVVPMTRAQYAGADRRAFPLPPKLFSHNDQQLVWQSHRPEGSAVGWGGRIGDLALNANGRSLFTCISAAAGSALFVAGESALTYQVNANGAVPVVGIASPVYGSTAVSQALATLATQPRDGVLEREYAKVTARSVDAYAQVSAAMNPVSLATTFPGTSIGNQLKTIARLIGGRERLGLRRQVFFAQIGGFDNHGSLLGQHPRLIGEISAAISAFYNATVELGVADRVSTFTGSEFGRTLSANGDGSDHGWGSHHFVVGGAVRGASFDGTAPPLSIGNTSAAEDQWHVGQGRLLPTTSVDQFAATLARWFGVADDELNVILPNLRNFGVHAGGIDYPRVLGFLGA